MEITKKKINNIKLTLFIILSYINIIIIGNLCKDSFYIENYNSSIVGVYLFLGILLYVMFFIILNKRVYKLSFILILLIIVFIIDRISVDFFYNYFNTHILDPYKYVIDTYNYGLSMDFTRIMPTIRLIIPITYCFIIYLINKFSLNIITLIDGVVLLIVWCFANDLLQSYMYILISAIFIMIIVNGLIRRMNKDIKTNDNIVIKGKVIIWICIPIVAVVAMSVVLSSTKQGFLGEQKIISRMNKYVYGNSEIQYGDQSVLYKIGYGNSSKKLGGSVALSDEVIMYVRASRPYYLRGNIKDYYDGRTWQTTKNVSTIFSPWNEEKYTDELINSYFDENGFINKAKVDDFYNKHSDRYSSDTDTFLDYSKSQKNIYDKADFTQFLLSRSKDEYIDVINIRYGGNLESHNFLVPNNSLMMKTGKPDDDYDISVRDNNIKYDKMGQVTSRDIINDEYTVSVYNNNSNNLFNDYLLEPKNNVKGYMDYNINTGLRYNEGDGYNQNVKYDKYSDIIGGKYKEYTKLPKSVSAAVYLLGDKITRNSTSTIEKVHAIKKYLEDNYAYSLQVDKINFEKDFVDQFLFDTKKGYCTYFASAMAILCRTQGIPARYVEGFSMEGLVPKNGSYKLTPNAAHAWCEVLVSPEHDVWAIADPETSMNPRKPEDNTTIVNKPVKTQEDIDAEKKRMEEEKKKELDNKDTKDVVVDKKPSEEVKVSSNKFKFSLLNISLLIILIVCLMVISLVSIIYYRYNRIVNDKSVRKLYKYYVKKLCYMKYKREPYETDLEFINKTSGTALYPYSKQLVEELNAELYGGIESTLDRKAFYKYINYFIKNDYKEELKQLKKERKLKKGKEANIAINPIVEHYSDGDSGVSNYDNDDDEYKDYDSKTEELIRNEFEERL